MRYRLEQRIHTLAEIAIDSTETGQCGFPVEDVTFSNWQTGEMMVTGRTIIGLPPVKWKPLTT